MARWKLQVVVLLLAAAALIAATAGQGSEAPEEPASAQGHKRSYEKPRHHHKRSYENEDEPPAYHHEPSYDEPSEYHHGPHDDRPCVGTTERPVREITLPDGDVFCLRMPRFLKNPQLSPLGDQFVRTWNDTCGLYSIIVATNVPQGGGPPPHVHFAEDEWFLPTTPGDVVRMHAQRGDASQAPKSYHPGQVPGFNMPPVDVGGIEVPYGSIAYAPQAVPHTFRGATSMKNFLAVWGFGFAMIPGVDISQSSTLSPQQVLEQTGLWGVPHDPTAAMFAQGPDFVNARGPVALPPVTWKNMLRLQSLFDRGEACFPH